ncbi:hypothetical protein N9O93_01985 [bacterium]|nr:hypothetical protein [bacterium]
MNKWLLVIVTLLTWPIFGQDDDLYDHGLDQNKWQEIRDGIRYEGVEEGPGRKWTYENDEEYEQERRRYGDGGGTGGGQGDGQGNGYDGQPRENRTYQTPPKSNANVETPSFGGLGILGYILLGVFVVALLVLIFYLFMNAERKGQKIDVTQVSDIEDVNPTEIPLTELQRLLQEALQNGDYRGAVRIYFIFVVRGLAEKGSIHWEKEKTNFHYLSEMTGKMGYEDFMISVTYFEFIWYGKREIDASKFEEVKPNFTRFLDKLGVK